MKLFGRYARVIVGQAGEVGKVWDKLRISFDIEKTTSSTANSAKITVYNLSGQSVALIKRPSTKISLEVAYEGFGIANPSLLFIGTITEVKEDFKGLDRVTEIQCADGYQEFSNSFLSRTWAANTSKTTIISDLISAMGVTYGSDARDAVSSLFPESTTSPYSVSGRAKDELDTLFKSKKTPWSVQDGEFRVGNVLDEQKAVLLMAETGLIGKPQLRKEGGVDFECLLNPKIRPTGTVRIIAKDVDGLFKIKSCTYTGDNFEGDWKIKGLAE